MSARDDIGEALAWRETRTVTANLTLHYDRMMLLLDPTPQARALARKQVEVVNYSHRALEQLLRSLNAAYNARRQRVLDGRTPDQVVAERLGADPKLARSAPNGRAGPCDTTRARLITVTAKEISQPDN